MKLSSDSKFVEILLDDKDMHDLLNGQTIGMGEIGVNDQRPITIKRHVAPIVKMSSNRERDQKGMAILTGETPFAKLKREHPEKPVPKLEMPEAKPFGIRRADDAIENQGQIEAKPESREKARPFVPREKPSRFRLQDDVQGGHEEQDIPDGSQTHRQETNNPQGRVVEENQEGSV